MNEARTRAIARSEIRTNAQEDYRNRIFFRQEFGQLPARSSVYNAYSPKSSGRQVNQEWLVSGANIHGFNSSRGVYFDTSGDGLMWMAASSKSSNRVLIKPRPNAAVNRAYSKFASMLWGTDEQVWFEAMLKTSAVAGSATVTSGEYIQMGLVLTHTFDTHSGATPTITDADRVTFVRDNRKSATRLYVLMSNTGADTFYDTGVDLASSTRYRLQLELQADRTVRAYVNNALKVQTGAMKTGVNLIPHISMRVTGNMAAHGRLGCYYTEISKVRT